MKKCSITFITIALAMSLLFSACAESIGMEGIGNARELGGYITHDGRTVKHGVLLRTAKLCAGTETDFAKLTDEYHLAVIADFREESDAAKEPDPQLEDVVILSLPVLNLETSGQKMAEAGYNAEDMESLSSLEQLLLVVDAGLMDDQFYINILSGERGKQHYAEMFEALLELPEGRSFLFHCSQGKDRTGIAAMLILSALGVDEETILKDFILTNDFNAALIAGEREMLLSQLPAGTDVEPYLFAQDLVSRAYMENALQYLKDSYGSVEGYLFKELELDEVKIKAIQDKFLEEY